MNYKKNEVISYEITKINKYFCNLFLMYFIRSTCLIYHVIKMFTFKSFKHVTLWHVLVFLFVYNYRILFRSILELHM